jgi:MFS family permease
MKWFMFAMVLANIAGSMGQMLTPLYLTDLGASITDLGIVFTITSIAILFLQVFGGWVSDSIGRLKAIAIGSIGGVIGSFLIAWAPTWQWMIIALVVTQIPYALVGPSFGAFIAENSAEENRGQVYGITDTIYQITGIVGPPLGGYLASQFNFKTMFLVAACLYTSAAGLRIWMATTMKSADERPPEKLTMTSFKLSLKNMFTMIFAGGVVTWIFLTDGVRDIAFRLSGELQPVYLEQVAGITVQQIGFLGAIFSLAMMFPPILSGKMADKYGERVPISIGFFMVFIAFVVFLNVSGFIAFAVVWVIFGTGVGLLSPAYSSLMSKVVPKNMLGTFTGLFYGSIGLVSLPAPYIGSQLWARFSPKLPFTITAAAALLTIIPIWYKFKVPEDPGGTAELAEATP